MAESSRQPFPAQEPAKPQETTDQRGSPRFTLLIRNAKIVYPSGEYLCVIRDVSASGLRIKAFHRLPEEEPLYLEMGTGERYSIAPVWQGEHIAGLRFREDQDVVSIIRDDGPYPKRSLRIMLQVAATVTRLGKSCPVTIENISQYGARLDCTERLAIEQRIVLAAENLPDIEATVRWRKGTQYGVAFRRTFRIEELAVLVAGLQDRTLID